MDGSLADKLQLDLLGAHEKLAKYDPINLNGFAKLCHEDNAKWWVDPETGEDWRNNKLALGSKIALIHSEISEALEGLRKGIPDEKLPDRSAEEVELVDALIRIFDYAAARKLDLDGAFWEKRAYNLKRADHKVENRVKEGGKKF